MLIEIWSDVVCPWCYIGKRRFEAALAQFPHADQVEVRWRSFQLDPTAPRSAVDDPPGVTRRLADKYGLGIAEAEAMVDRVTQAAAGEGLEFHQENSRGRATLDAHRLLHAASADAQAGADDRLQDQVKERFMRAYFTQGERIDDRDVLARLAVEAGMEPDRVASVLAGDEFADEVRADQAEAAAMGANGVPFFVADRRIGVSGAQPAAVFTQLLEQAWASRTPVSVLAGSPDADACGPDGCAI